MLFSLFAPYALIHLKSRSLDVHTKDGQFELLFPATIIDNEEIKDVNALAVLIRDFLQEKQIKDSKAVILLSDELVFQHVISEAEKEKVADARLLFVEDLPFEPEFASVVTRSDDQASLFLAADKRFFGTVKAIFTGLRWRVETVLPAAAFPAVVLPEVLRLKGKAHALSFV